MPGAESDERPSRVYKRSKPYLDAQKALGARVKALRKARNWTLQQAADRMELDLKHLQKVEAAELNVTLVTLVRIAEGFGEPLTALFAAPSRQKKKPE